MRKLLPLTLAAAGALALTSGVFAQDADLDGIKTYLLEMTAELDSHTQRLADAAADYYALAEAAAFDYESLANDDAARAIVVEAQDAWMTASPLYERVEGIVAGVPTLSEYDVILDAGVSGEEDPEGGVPFDLTLADGRVLERPGNLFGLLESTLWGTRAEFTTDVEIDLDEDGAIAFGERLPEANMLAAAGATMAGYTAELLESAEAWTPNETDAFTALVVMTPTMSEYFGSWKESRFIAGDEGTAEFGVISRLADIGDILSGLQVVYDGVSPLIREVDARQEAQIADGLTDLQTYVGALYEQEQEGRVFTPEEADIFGSEAQDRAMTITGQIAQAAGLLDIALPE